MNSTIYFQMIADAVSSEDDKAMDTTAEPDEGISAQSDDDTNSELGTKVEAKFQSKWYESYFRP